jgi:hypothetical protein
LFESEKELIKKAKDELNALIKIYEEDKEVANKSIQQIKRLVQKLNKIKFSSDY